MTQEDKDLLLKDLCMRLPYRVMVENILTHKIFDLSKYLHCLPAALENFKPYLRPMSSMTEEEDREWQYYKNAIAESCDRLLEKRIAKLHDWFCRNHFDYRGLIPMGLALEAPEGMYN